MRFYALGVLVEHLHALKRDSVNRIAALEARVKGLEAAPRGLKYCGVYAEGRTYEPNELVTHRGSMWICLDKTGLRPDEAGEAVRAWQLCVKKGRDGKDARS